MEKLGNSCHVCQVIGDASWVFIVIGALTSILTTNPELGKLAAYMFLAGLAIQLGSVVSAALKNSLHGKNV